MPAVVALVHFGAVCGCPAFKSSAPERAEIVEEIQVNGFDPQGEPVIKRWSNGSVWIQFEAMPPFFAHETGAEPEFETFEETLSQALGVMVSREDRELFVIEKPAEDTASRAKAWLENFRSR